MWGFNKGRGQTGWSHYQAGSIQTRFTWCGLRSISETIQIKHHIVGMMEQPTCILNVNIRREECRVENRWEHALDVSSTERILQTILLLQDLPSLSCDIIALMLGGWCDETQSWESPDLPVSWVSPVSSVSPSRLSLLRRLLCRPPSRRSLW